MNRYPKIVVSIKDPFRASDLKKIKKAGGDIVEYRIDFCNSLDSRYLSEQIGRIKKAGLPVLGTFRSFKEGGNKNVPEQLREKVLETVIPLVQYIDIELSSKQIIDSILHSSRSQKVKTIISFHDFDKTPSDTKILKVFESAMKKNPDMVKIATKALSRKDILRLFIFTMNHANKQNLTTIAMGEQGECSRIFFPIAGSSFTYTFVSDSTAPGQIPLEECAGMIQRFYRNFN